MVVQLPQIEKATAADLKPGTRVLYQTGFGFGGGAMFEGEIVGDPAFDDANEAPVWDVRTDHAGTRWGYLDQFFIETNSREAA